MRFRTIRNLPFSNWFEKAFDSLNHNFLITSLEYYSFANNFIKWIKILLKNQESCVINGCHTTEYFRPERGARQEDPTSTYLFILVLDISFMFIKFDKNIDGINIFNHKYRLCWPYNVLFKKPNFSEECFR